MANVKTFPVRRNLWVGARRESVLFTIEIDLDDLPEHLFHKALNNKSGQTTMAYGAVRLILSDLK